MILPAIVEENVFVPATVWFPLVSTTFPESLASGTVPDAKFDAFKFVSPDPFHENDVAVIDPAV